MTMAACDGGEFELGGYSAEEVFDDPKAARLARAAARGDIAEIEAAIADGADPNYQGVQEITPFFWGFYAGDKAGFKRLYQLGGDPIQQDYKTRTVTQLSTEWEDPDFLEILLKNGMDPDIEQGQDSEPALMEAIGYRRMPQVELLLAYCADLHWINRYGTSVAIPTARRDNYDLLHRLFDEGFAYNLVDVAGVLERKKYDENSTELIEKRQRAIERLKTLGVEFPTVRPDPPVPPRLAPLYAKSCLERRKAEGG